jgi:hypothetical protein
MAIAQKRFLMVDVETAGGLGNPLVYDLGLAVVTKKGEILAKRSFIIKEIFNDKSLMSTAYYAEKVPQYQAEIAQGLHEVVTFPYALNVIADMIREFKPQIVSAYNLAFDKRAIANTTQKLYGFEFKFNLQELCVWSLACELLFTQKMYPTIAVENGWVSEANNLRTNAEVAYRYITKNYDFAEKHMGLADVEIEAEILAKCLAQRKSFVSGIISHPWKIPNKKYRESLQ